MAQVERTQIDNTSSILKVSITKADYLPEFQSQLKSYRGRVQMKGFRPGTVPMPMVKKLYGKSILYEVMMETINKELFEHINTSGLNILARPELVEEQTDKMEKLNVDQPMEQAPTDAQLIDLLSTLLVFLTGSLSALLASNGLKSKSKQGDSNETK